MCVSKGGLGVGVRWDCWDTINACFYRVLYRGLKDLSLPPYLHHTSEFGLNVGAGGLEGNGCGLGDDWGECNEEVIFLPRSRLLRYLVGEIYQVESFIRARVLQPLQPDLGGAICMSPEDIWSDSGW